MHSPGSLVRLSEARTSLRGSSLKIHPPPERIDRGSTNSTSFLQHLRCVCSQVASFFMNISVNSIERCGYIAMQSMWKEILDMKSGEGSKYRFTSWSVIGSSCFYFPWASLRRSRTWDQSPWREKTQSRAPSMGLSSIRDNPSSQRRRTLLRCTEMRWKSIKPCPRYLFLSWLGAGGGVRTHEILLGRQVQ